MGAPRAATLGQMGQEAAAGPDGVADAGSELVVVCGAVPWAGPMMLDQHLAHGLSRYGSVLYVEPAVPWRPGRRSGGAARSNGRPPGAVDLTEVGPRLTVCTPHALPGHERAGVKRASVAIVRRSVRVAVRRLGDPVVRALIVTSPDPYLGTCRERRSVYYVTDDYAAGASLMGLSARRLHRDMRRRPAEADLVVAASPKLAATLRAEGHQALLLPNGCDPSAFADTDAVPRPPDAPGPAPVAGFVGHLSDRIDVRFLEAIARRGHTMLLVGPGPRHGLGPDLRALAQRSNVHWIGPRPFDRLPGYLQAVDVGLVPYTDTAFNHASFPLKALEYLAAGRPVLSTDIEAIRWLRDGNTLAAEGGGPVVVGAEDIVVAAEPEEFADAAERLMDAPRTDVAVARRRAVAAAHSWEQRFATLADALDLAAGP